MPYILTCGNYFIFFTGSPEGEIRDSIQINESKDEGITTVATTKSNEEDETSSSNIDLRNLDTWNIYVCSMLWTGLYIPIYIYLY